MSDSVDRWAARLVVVDGAGRVLLFCHAPATAEPFWATPGGGLEDGETFEQAAAREAREELGLADVQLEPIGDRTTLLEWCDPPIRQRERYFLLRHEPMEFDEAVREFHRRERLVETRWFSIAELEACARRVYPESLAMMLRGARPDSGPAEVTA